MKQIVKTMKGSGDFSCTSSNTVSSMQDQPQDEQLAEAATRKW